MTIREFTIQFLKAMEAAIEPPSNCHHAITYARYGSEAEGWTEKLALQINRDGRFYCFFLEEDDLQNYDRDNIQRSVSEIVEQLKLPDSAFQIGSAMGKYQ